MVSSPISQVLLIRRYGPCGLQTSTGLLALRYAYAFNNPATFTDPSGQMPPGVLGAPVISIPGYTPSPFAGPSYAPVPETQGGPGYLPPSTGSGRSANTAAWSPFSDPYARQQSQGFRPRPCGIGDVLHGLWGNPQGGGLLPELLEFGLHGARNNKSWVADAGSWLGYTTTANLAQLNWWLSNPYNLQATLGALVIGGAVIFTGGAAIPAIILGAGIGAGISAGVQVWDNYWQQAPSLLDINWRDVLWGAFHGAVAAAGAELIAPLLPSGGVGLMGAAQIGFSEFVAGRASQVALNLATGQAWNKGLLGLKDIALDVLPGVGASTLKTWKTGRAAARVEDFKKALKLEGAIQPEHIELIRHHPLIKAAVESNDLPTLRRLLGISEEGIGVPLAAHLNDLRERNFSWDADLYKQAVLESGKGGKAFGKWARGSGLETEVNVLDVEGGAWHLQPKLRNLEDGTYMYTIDTQNEIRYAPIPSEEIKPRRYVTHAQLVGGQFILPSSSKKVWGAGEFEVRDGQIVLIDTGSGHFRPPPEFIIYTEGVFRSKGFNLEKTEFKTYPPQTVNQRIVEAVQKRIKRPLEKRGLWPKGWWPHIQ